jgi:hypothetical protein
MLHHDSDTYWISRQQDMLPTNRLHGLVNSINVTDRSEGRRLIAQTANATARVGTIIGAVFASAGMKIAKIFSASRPSIP